MPPTPKRQPTKKQRKHIPALLPDTLKVKLDELKSLKLTAGATQTLEDILKSASNPDHGKVDVVVKSLPEDRQKLIRKTAKAMKSITDDVMARGKKQLMAMSEEEWNALLDDE